jgi:hypothetical protein
LDLRITRFKEKEKRKRDNQDVVRRPTLTGRASVGCGYGMLRNKVGIMKIL